MVGQADYSSPKDRLSCKVWETFVNSENGEGFNGRGIQFVTGALEWDNHIQNLQMGRYIFQTYGLKSSFTALLMRHHKTIFLTIYLTIYTKKSLAIYFGDSQFRKNMIFYLIISKKHVDKRSRVR